MTEERKTALEFQLWRVVNGLYTPIMRKPGDELPTHEEMIEELERLIANE